MLTTLRNNAQSWMVKALLGVICITFVISFGIGTFSNPKEVLVKVGDKEILVTDFMHEYNQQLEQLRRRFPKTADQLADQLNLRKQVMDTMVNRYLMLTAAHNAGLMVTKDQVRDRVMSTPAFQRGGRFDFATYRQVLAQNDLTPTQYESDLHADLLLQQFQRNQVAGLIVSQPEIDQRYRIENEQTQVNFVYVDPARLHLPRAPTQAELKAYYKAHPDEFTQPAQFKLQYFVLPLSALEKGVNVRERAVQRYYERNIAQYSTPKQVRASHILRRLPKNASVKQVVAARQLLDSVLAKAKAGADFAKLAKKYSQDPSAANGGDLGFFTKDEMVSAVSDAAFSLPKGGISGIVRSPFGLHIIKVTAIKPGTRKPLAAVKDQIEHELRATVAQRRLKQDLATVPERLRNEGLEAVAKSFGQPVQTTPLFDEHGVLPGLGSAAPLYAQIHNRHRGDVGVWHRNPVQGDVFYRVQERKSAFLLPMEKVHSQLVQATETKQQHDQAIALAKDTLPKLRDGKSLAAFAKRHGLKVQSASFTVVDSSIPGVGVNHPFQRAAFGLTKDKPYALNIKDDKAYLIQFKRRFIPDAKDEKEKKAQIAQRMADTLQKFVLSQEVQHLRSQVKVDVRAPEYLASSNASGSGRTP